MFFKDESQDKINLNDNQDFIAFSMFEVPDNLNEKSIKIFIENIEPETIKLDLIPEFV
jgi:hypothetical protein